MRSVLLLIVFFVVSGCTNTLPVVDPASTITKIAFGSCAVEWVEQPVWNTIVDSEPDLYLSLGDAIYGDWDGSNRIPVDQHVLEKKWRMLAAKTEFKRARNSIPMYATWDNHDYGTYDGGTDFPLKSVSKQLFLDFWREPLRSRRRSREGIYMAKRFGPAGKRVQIILLDTRSFKDPPTKKQTAANNTAKHQRVGPYTPNWNSTVTLLGEAQWSWLEEQFRKPADLRLLISSTQVIAEKGLDEWAIYPRERERLLMLMRKTRAEGALILSGNVHFSEISVLRTFDYPLYDFTASGMTPVNIQPRYADADNPQRTDGPFVDVNFGLITIDWSKPKEAEILLESVSLDGSIAFRREIALDSLTFSRNSP